MALPPIPKNRLPKLLVQRSAQLPFFRNEAQAELLRVGLSNIAILVRDADEKYLVKFAVAPASKPSVFIQANYEKKIAGRLKRLEITPDFLSSGKVKVAGKAFPYSIQQYLPGCEPAYSGGELRAIGKTLRKLHKATEGNKRICDYRVLLPAKYLQKQSEKYFPEYDAHPGEKTEILRKMNEAGAAALGDIAPPGEFFSLIHNDLTPENILISGSRAYLIDWGWAMYSSSAFDICNFLSPFTTSWSGPKFLSEKDARVFLDSYFSNLPVRKKSILLGSVRNYWLAYNSLLANWIYFDFLPQHPLEGRLHFKGAGFLKKAAHASIKLNKFLASYRSI